MASSPAAAAPRMPASTPSSPVRVLIADDSAVVRGLVARWITEAGFQLVGTASNGKIALEMMSRHDPDVVLLDIDMPELDGTEALPRMALAGFALALALCFTGGVPALLGAVFTGALGCALTMVGLAAMHRRSRGRTARGLLLFTAYASIVLLSIPLFAFLALGLFETAKSPALEADTDQTR